MFTVYYSGLFGDSVDGIFKTYDEAVAYIEGEHPSAVDTGDGVFSWFDEDGDCMYILKHD